MIGHDSKEPAMSTAAPAARNSTRTAAAITAAIIAGLVQAVLLLLAQALRERLTGPRIVIRPFVLLGGIVGTFAIGSRLHGALGGVPDDWPAAWLVSLVVRMLVGIQKLRIRARVMRSPLEVIPPEQWPAAGLEDVTVRTKTVEGDGRQP